MTNTNIDEVMAVSFFRDQYGFEYFDSMGDEGCFDQTMSTEEYGRVDWADFTTGDWRKEEKNRIIYRLHQDRWIIKAKKCEKYDIRLHKHVKGYFYSKNNDSDMETTTYWSDCDELVEMTSTTDSYGNTESENRLTENIMAYSFHRDDYGWEYFQEMSAVGFEELPVQIEGISFCVDWEKYSTGIWSKEQKIHEI